MLRIKGQDGEEFLFQGGADPLEEGLRLVSGVRKLRDYSIDDAVAHQVERAHTLRGGQLGRSVDGPVHDHPPVPHDGGLAPAR